MRSLLFILPFVIAAPALGDCRAEIAALYDGGAMDEFTRRPHHIEMTDYAADGTMTERHVGQQINGTHYTLFSEMRGMGVLYVGTEVWYQMSKDAAWGNKQTMPAVRKDDLMRQQAEKAASISEEECLGTMQGEGEDYLVYRWRVFTDTSEEHGGGINGAVHEAWVDPDTGELAILKDSDVVTPWMKEPDGSTRVTRYRYDDGIVITPPEG